MQTTAPSMSGKRKDARDPRKSTVIDLSSQGCRLYAYCHYCCYCQCDYCYYYYYYHSYHSCYYYYYYYY